MLASWEQPRGQKAGCRQGWRGAVVGAEGRLWGHAGGAKGLCVYRNGTRSHGKALSRRGTHDDALETLISHDNLGRCVNLG